MKQTDKVELLKLATSIYVDLSEDKILEAKLCLGSFIKILADRFDMKDESLQASLGIPVCICEDGRGWSTCGGECGIHRPIYMCGCEGCKKCIKEEGRADMHKGCVKKVAYMQVCIRCSRK